MGPTPFYGARAEKTPFAIKQTNICRLSGDIMTQTIRNAVCLLSTSDNIGLQLAVAVASCSDSDDGFLSLAAQTTCTYCRY